MRDSTLTRRTVPLLAVASLLVVKPTAGTFLPEHARSGRLVTFTVDSTADASDAHPGDGRCADTAGRCTLRAAVDEANAEQPGTKVEVVVPPGIYDLTLGSLEFRANTVSVIGSGASSTVVAGDGSFRVAHVGAGATVTLAGVTLTGGDAGDTGYGGAALNTGSLTLASSLVTRNTAIAGGGLANAGGTLVVAGTTVSNNVGLVYGGGGIQNGGIHNVAGKVEVIGSIVSGNETEGDGGGILNGQNGHPSVGDTPAAAALSFATMRQGTGPRPATDTNGLRLVVRDSTFDDDQSGNAGSGLANDGGATIVDASSLDHDHTPDAIGGGISTYGSLILTRSDFVDDSSCYGGGIETFGGGVNSTTSIATSLFEGDKATCFGGAIDVSGTSVTVIRSTFAHNWSANGGGGAAVEIEGSSSGSFTNSTFYENSNGSAIQTFECGPAHLIFDTFSGNTDAMDASCPDVSSLGTILANSTGANCLGDPPNSEGYNLDSGDSCELTESTDITNADPDLAPLASNGGPTPTMALLSASPALDHGGTPSTGCPPVDQRGVSRPQGPECDIGAFEKHVG